MTKKLLLATPYFPPEGGGLEQYARRLANALIEHHGWTVVAVASGAQRRGIVEHYDGDIKVYRLPHQLLLSRTRIGVTWLREMKRIIGDEAPALINAHAPVPGIADAAVAARGDIPAIVTYHTGSMRKGKRLTDMPIGFYERNVMRTMLQATDAVITSSDFVRKSFLTEFSDKSVTISPGVDVRMFTPAESLAEQRIVWVSGLDRGQEHKGLAELLEVVAKLATERPDLKLDIVGSGNNEQHYRELCEALSITGRVQFLGRLHGDALVNAYRGATVLAHPTRNDSYPMVLLEAMACALPVVSTYVGEIHKIVDDGVTGFLVEAGDAQSLANRLAQVLDDRDLAIRLGANGRKKVQESLTWEQKANATNDLFHSIIGRGVRV